MSEKWIDKIEANADAVFGRGGKLPDGHRERFEHRLNQMGSERATEHPIIWKKRLFTVTILISAAMIAGFVFLLNLTTEPPSRSELAEVSHYYHMQLEEQADITKRLVQSMEHSNREALLANIEEIENEPVPAVQIPDDEYIILISTVYTHKIEALQNIQNIIKEIP
jgi:hypothetical protein